MNTSLPAELAALRSIVVLAPHPDDEILGCGNLLRAFTAASVASTVVWLTDGGAAFGPLSESARADLTEQRAAEALAGLKSMDIDCDAHFLNYPDGELARHVEAAVERVRAIAQAKAAEAIFVTDAGDGHPDHRAAFEIARQTTGLTLYAYPVSARYDGDAVQLGRDAIAIDATDPDAKRKGLARHVSQHEGGAALYPMTAAAIDRFCAAPELFFRVESQRG